MKNKDQILLEQAYSEILKENFPKIPSDGYADGGEPYEDDELESLNKEEPFHFVYDDMPNNIGYSNKTFNVRGKDVLVKIEWDNMDDDEWNYLSLVDPETKERVFPDITEDQIKQLWKN